MDLPEPRILENAQTFSNRENSTTVGSKVHPADQVCLILNMIVKNESKIIHRCFDSTLFNGRPIISGISIVDTGSTDKTMDLIREWAHRHQVKLHLTELPFKNFGINRTHSMMEAKKAFPNSDYLLLIDADMILEFYPEDWEFELTLLKSKVFAGISLFQYNSTIEYANMRLVRTDMPWICIMPTHEYYAVDKDEWLKQQPEAIRTDNSSEKVCQTWKEIETIHNFRQIEKIYNEQTRTRKMFSLRINDLGDGGSKADKFIRDIRLLSEELEVATDPGIIQRCRFYLGQSYKCLNKYLEAIEQYRIRATLGGFAEEVFYSHMQIGECYECLGNAEPEDSLKKQEYYDAAVGAYLRSWNSRPTRAEPLFLAARMLRYHRGNATATELAWIGANLPQPQDDTLFLDYRVYQYLLWNELVINAYYHKPRIEWGKEAIRRLYQSRYSIPSGVYEGMKKNAEFYRKMDGHFDQECAALERVAPEAIEMKSEEIEKLVSSLKPVQITQEDITGWMTDAAVSKGKSSQKKKKKRPAKPNVNPITPSDAPVTTGQIFPKNNQSGIKSTGSISNSVGLDSQSSGVQSIKSNSEQTSSIFFKPIQQTQSNQSTQNISNKNSDHQSEGKGKEKEKEKEQGREKGSQFGKLPRKSEGKKSKSKKK